MKKILFLASEAYPLIKTGGLGDVAGSLPRALVKNKQDVRLLLPAYRSVLDKVENAKEIAEHWHYGQHIKLLETRLPGTQVKTWLVDCPAAFDRPGNPYLDENGHGWHDNAFRFAVFCQVAVDIAVNRCSLDWQPDVVHCNDWQTGLVPAVLQGFAQRPATVFTIHNLAYQGLFPYENFQQLGLPPALWSMDGVEFHGMFSFIKAGLVFANRLNTVSPTYAREIQTAEFGNGLDGLLQHRQAHLSGIMNGIDPEVWNPGTDEYLLHKYNRRSLKKKTANKTELQLQLGLPVDATIPMIGMVSRLVEQKGLDIILGSMSELLKRPLQLVFLGSGNPVYEKTLSEWAHRHPDKIAVQIGYDETLSHRIEAAADMYLMPSSFEPCGLNQLYSLRYGTLPVVRQVGGLADSIIDTTEASMAAGQANGFVIEEHNVLALITAIDRALSHYQNPSEWQRLQQNAMSADYSWQHSALQYLELYDAAIQDNENE
ncbi:MAG: glycogen synthase GlgA [Gammaproteobacteria bacterium]|nr:MAG: glycogen synthase GlgA [Gammaproteobacteria bacterium]